jgi:prepilin-type N-terminal cleavage/methylation domain-containing protein
METRRGFTLIEILVVTVVITVLRAPSRPRVQARQRSTP